MRAMGPGGAGRGGRRSGGGGGGGAAAGSSGAEDAGSAVAPAQTSDTDSESDEGSSAEGGGSHIAGDSALGLLLGADWGPRSRERRGGREKGSWAHVSSTEWPQRLEIGDMVRLSEGAKAGIVVGQVTRRMHGASPEVEVDFEGEGRRSVPTAALRFELLDNQAQYSRPKRGKPHPDVRVTPAEPVQSPVEVMLECVGYDTDEESVDFSDDSDSAGGAAFDIRRFEDTAAEDEDELESAPELFAQLIDLRAEGAGDAWVHLDLEFDNNEPGGHIIQLSCVIVDPMTGGLEQDLPGGPEFDMMVKPPSDAEWSRHTVLCHGYEAADFEEGGRFADALPLRDVWPKFEKWVNDSMEALGKTGVCCAWNGLACEMTWAQRVISRGYKWPTRCPLFYDPLPQVRQVSHPLNHAKYGGPDEGTALSVVYRLVVWLPHCQDVHFIDGAHNSLQDARAQSRIVHTREFHPRRVGEDGKVYHVDEATRIDDLTIRALRGSHMQYVEDLLYNKEIANERKVEQELNRPVPEPWTEELRQSVFPAVANYDASLSGPTSAGQPTTWPEEIELELPGSLCRQCAQWSNAYAEQDVVQRKGAKTLRQANDGDDPGKVRQRGSKKKVKGLTQGSVRVYHGLEFAAAAMGTTVPRLYSHEFGSGRAPWVTNAMTERAYKMHREYLCYNDIVSKDAKNRLKGQPAQKDPLYNVRPLLDVFQSEFPKLWTAGGRLVIDESMVRYGGKRIKFIQYMPNKPIKHGIKIFALCDADTGYLIAFRVFTEKRDSDTSKPTAVVLDLLANLGYEAQPGRILYADNWYTRVELAGKLAEQFQMGLVGTVRTGTKKSLTGETGPYSKPKGAAAKKQTPPGWARRAVAPLSEVSSYNGQHGHVDVEMCIWRDKKIVTFLDSARPGRPMGDVPRWSKREEKKVNISAPPSVAEYNALMGGVDNLDQDIAQNGAHPQFKNDAAMKNLAWWVINASAANGWQRVTHYDDPPEAFAEYQRTNRPDNRYRYNMRRAMEMIKLGLREGWAAEGGPGGESAVVEGKKKFGDGVKGKRPAWCPKRPLPCDCGKCFHCEGGMTCGIAHARRPKRGQKSRAGSDALQCRVADLKVHKGGGKCSLCHRRLRAQEGGEHLTNAEVKNRKCKAKWICTGCKRDDGSQLKLCAHCALAHTGEEVEGGTPGLKRAMKRRTTEGLGGE